ncbi:MAG: hypothetical protein ACRDJC_11840, partial [Thermomicrobiales bacterium]
TSFHALIILPDSGATEVTAEGLDVNLEGTDTLDQAIKETVTMGGDFNTATGSTRAFKIVTKITVPTKGGASDTISVGLGPALGVDCNCDIHSFKGQFNESRTYTFTHDFDETSKNSVTFDATLNDFTNQAVNYVPATFPASNRIYV